MKSVEEATARDYMSTRLVTLEPEMDVLEAMQRLLDERISGAPVVDSRGNLLGILTQRDCLGVAVQAAYHQEPAGAVSKYMTQKVDTLPASASLVEVIEAFRQSRYRRFPVLEGSRLVGQISRRDILHAILELW
ncbi:MAG: CBS domain-containing protein [Myxococcota bacterium]